MSDAKAEIEAFFETSQAWTDELAVLRGSLAPPPDRDP